LAVLSYGTFRVRKPSSLLPWTAKKWKGEVGTKRDFVAAQKWEKPNGSRDREFCVFKIGSISANHQNL